MSHSHRRALRSMLVRPAKARNEQYQFKNKQKSTQLFQVELSDFGSHNNICTEMLTYRDVETSIKNSKSENGSTISNEFQKNFNSKRFVVIKPPTCSPSQY